VSELEVTPYAPAFIESMRAVGYSLESAVSYKNRVLSARCWDLDLIAERRAWILRILDSDDEIKALPHVDEIVHHGCGTVILWQDLDRLAAGEISVEKALEVKMDHVREHLAVVFHRYLSGETGLRRLNIEINNNPISAVDIFLASHKATQPLNKDAFSVEGHEIRVQPYILPHISKLSAEDLRLAGGEEGLRRNQGFYIYRNSRLIIRGTWFRLARAEELTKLARVRVDIPNALDHLWTLDIKKSSAHPPEIVRRNLSRTVDRIADRSRQTYTFRGRKTQRDGIIHAWNRIQGRDGISYRINREHPVLNALVKSVDDDQRRLIGGLLDTLESTYPADALYADMASDRPRPAGDIDLNSLRELALQILDAAGSLKNRNILLQILHTIEPFSSYSDLTSGIVKELENAE